MRCPMTLFIGIKELLYNYWVEESTELLPINMEWFLSVIDDYEYAEIEGMYIEIQESKYDDLYGWYL